MSDLNKYKDTKIEKVMNKSMTSVSPRTKVDQAAQLMKEHKVGAVLVMDQKALVGIFTERDVLYRVVCDNLNPRETEVSKVMTKNVFTIKATQTVEAAILLASTNNVRHIPVVDDSKNVTGVIGMKDIMGQILEFTLPL